MLKRLWENYGLSDFQDSRQFVKFNLCNFFCRTRNSCIKIYFIYELDLQFMITHFSPSNLKKFHFLCLPQSKILWYRGSWQALENLWLVILKIRRNFFGIINIFNFISSLLCYFLCRLDMMLSVIWFVDNP